jgi:N-formylglutamate amidohydrolase
MNFEAPPPAAAFGNGSSLDAPPVFRIDWPAEAVATAPLIFCSPHSGTDYSDAFLRRARLDFATLRKSEDSHVDALFAAAPAKGVPLLAALFPRAFIDPNREPFELDPGMFEDRLPDYVNTASPRVAAGLGTIARVVCNGAEIYKSKLRFAEALARVNTYYRPYHDALQRLIAVTTQQFGQAFVIDCHSMPSIGGPMDRDPGAKRVDFVIGDGFGTSCPTWLVAATEAALKRHGYAVARNMPYAGGYTTRHYGKPATGCHAMQIEINRALYMDEDSYARRPYFATLQLHISALIAELASVTQQEMAA